MLIGTLTKRRADSFTNTLSHVVHYQVRWSRPTARRAPKPVPRANQPKVSYSVLNKIVIDSANVVQIVLLYLTKGCYSTISTFWRSGTLSSRA